MRKSVYLLLLSCSILCAQCTLQRPEKKHVPTNQPAEETQAAQPAGQSEPARQGLSHVHGETSRQHEGNEYQSSTHIHEIGQVNNEELFHAILSKFHGHTLLIDFWATWCGPCRMAHKQMQPLKEEWKEQDIVYLYIAGENSPEGIWREMIGNIHGEHFRVTEEQWEFLANQLNIQGVPTYFIVNRNGEITGKSTGFPGINGMKKMLQTAMAQ